MIGRFDKLLLDNWNAAQDWFRGHVAKVDMPVYTSVDLRNAGHKLAPVDTNIYPAGFNNLCALYNEECVISFDHHIKEKYGNISKILIIAEAHTRNVYYIENIRSLARMLERDGYEVKTGFASDEMWKESLNLDGLSGPLAVRKVSRSGDTLQAADFVPDIIINNNDFSEGVPEFIKGISQPIDPPPELGWALRRKNRHFEILDGLMKQLAAILELDPWLLQPLTVPVHEVHFGRMEGLDRIAQAIDDLIAILKLEHEEHGVDEEPFVFVKSNYGTYGMAVTTAASGEGFLDSMKKERKKMRKGKGGVEVREVIVQEGVPTADFHDQCPVEPVIYIIGGDPVGGFYRINCERTIRENLNTRGMTFSKICFHQLENRKPEFLDSASSSDTVMMRVWGTLARVAAIAAAYEAQSLTSGQNAAKEGALY